MSDFLDESDDDDDDCVISVADSSSEFEEEEEEERPKRKTPNTPKARNKSVQNVSLSKAPTATINTANTTKEETKKEQPNPSAPLSAKQTPPKKPPSRKRPAPRSIYDANGYDIVVAPSSHSPLENATTKECSLLLQIDEFNHEGGADVDWTSAIGGIIGRLELPHSEQQWLRLDLQGRQYQGYLFPGPTALVMKLTQESSSDDAVLKIEHMTDEFCNLVRRPETTEAASSSSSKLDHYFSYQGDVDVNREGHPPVVADSKDAVSPGGGGGIQRKSPAVARSTKKKRSKKK